ncbi:hypothetical protein [Phenylobacterium sp.]|uniref:hypothetical protein n=1 Tax=Phenylobacterium sp. TaxID=1871053 RepID=UPI0027171F65|nr:hypothetical protein [Phenylobacterium sp.]MDO8378430.1 hypothetical protein [Phenylobacterium sp.]
MPGISESDDGADAQDQAETQDEAKLDDREEVGEMRTFEELPELLDVTTAAEDDDQDGLMADNDDTPGPDDVEGPYPVRTQGDAAEPALEGRLDQGLEESFPASDPLAVSPRND